MIKQQLAVLITLHPSHKVCNVSSLASKQQQVLSLSTSRAMDGNDESAALLPPRGQEEHADDDVHASLSAGLQDFSSSSKALKLFVIHVICYYSLAVILFSFVVEKFTVIDSLYFATVLFTTIGYGDLVPSSAAGRTCTILLALYGITVLGIFLG
jgi:Ion channel